MEGPLLRLGRLVRRSLPRRHWALDCIGSWAPLRTKDTIGNYQLWHEALCFVFKKDCAASDLRKYSPIPPSIRLYRLTFAYTVSEQRITRVTVTGIEVELVNLCNSSTYTLHQHEVPIGGTGPSGGGTILLLPGSWC